MSAQLTCRPRPASVHADSAVCYSASRGLVKCFCALWGVRKAVICAVYFANAMFRVQALMRRTSASQLLHHVVNASTRPHLCRRFEMCAKQCYAQCRCEKKHRAGQFAMFSRAPAAVLRVRFFEYDGPSAPPPRRDASGSLCDLAWLPLGGRAAVLRRCCLPPPGNGGAGVGRLPPWLASREQQLWSGPAPRRWSLSAAASPSLQISCDAPPRWLFMAARSVAWSAGRPVGCLVVGYACRVPCLWRRGGIPPPLAFGCQLWGPCRCGPSADGSQAAAHLTGAVALGLCA